MKGYLSRGKARAKIVLLFGGLAVMLFGLVVQFDALFWVGVVTMLLSLGFFQGCPHCGKHPRYTPQWSGQGKYYCSFCGERLSYDDEV